MKTILRIAATLQLAISAASADETKSAADPLAAVVARMKQAENPSVLFIGNSYSFYVPKAFGKLAASKGRRIHVEQVTNGGWTLAQHAKNPPTLEKIRSRRWDVVVIQEQSKIPSYPASRRDPLMFPPLRVLVAEVRRQGALPVLYQTWGRRGGNPELKGDSTESMTKRLREGYRAAAAEAGNLAIVPVGDVWETEVAAGNADKLYQKDNSHPADYGNALTARIFYQAMFPGGEEARNAPQRGSSIRRPR
jgi:hypothetical protein